MFLITTNETIYIREKENELKKSKGKITLCNNHKISARRKSRNVVKLMECIYSV